jgi:hypothetical protein
MPPGSPPSAIAGEWIDSREIADIVMAEPGLSSLTEGESLWMALRTEEDTRLIWQVYRDCHGIADRRHDRTALYVDALNGHILFEIFEQRDLAGGKTIAKRVRRRWIGSDWEDLDPNDGGGALGSPSIH